MKRILIIGCSGAGKTTLSIKLVQKLGIELISLDQNYWNAGWTKPSKIEWSRRVGILMKKDRWIIDGNYGGTLELRIKRADTVIFLNYSTVVCLTRVIKRTIRYYGKRRPEMASGCRERFNLEFILYVLNFKRLRVPIIVKMLDKFKKDKEVYVFRNDVEVDFFLRNIV